MQDPERPDTASGSLAGRNLAGYRVLHKIGAGGMGEVYLAVDQRLQRRVAIKVLKESTYDPDGEHLIKEARAVARLNHSGIAMIFDILQIDGRWHIVMEYVDGQTLADLLRHEHQSFDRLISIGSQITEALIHAHTHGIVHRDLKPANIRITPDDKIKILDFGLAKSGSTLSSEDTSTRETSSHHLVGTPAYMSPEQLLQRPLDPRTDVYSLGIMMFEMAAGRRPFVETAFVPLVTAILTSEAPPLKTLRPDLPEAFCTFVKRAMSRAREDRYASMEEVHAELQRIGMQFPNVSSEALPEKEVLVVLPFLNATGDSTNDFIGVGLCEVLIANVATLQGLDVPSRSSVFQYRGQTRNVKRVSRELGARYVVDGSYQRSEDRIRLTVSLLESNTDRVLWSDQIDGSLKNIFELQNTVCARVAAAVPMKHRVATDTNFPTLSVEAFSDYARARVLLERPDIPGNSQRASELLEGAIRLDPRFALAHAALGEAYWERYIRSNDPSWTIKSLSSLTEALRLQSHQAQVRRTLARIYTGTGRHELAMDELRAAMNADPRDDETRRCMGDVLFDLGSKEQAVRCFEEAIRLRPNFWKNHAALGIAWYRMAKYDRAINAFVSVVALQPDNAWGYQMLGTSYHAAGDLDRALENYYRSMEITPTGSAASNIGTIWYGRKNYDEALKFYEHAIKLRPHVASTHRNLGDTYEKLGYEAKAREAFARAVEIASEALKVKPNDPANLSRLAVYEAKLGRFDAARQHAAQASQLEPLDVEVTYRGAVVHALAGDIPQALADLKRAIERGYSMAMISGDDDLVAVRSTDDFINAYGGSSRL
jgi:serine/threonine protein kinase/tetratricopeptide (TPR) repeat protein